jgi:hypothetical protein
MKRKIALFFLIGILTVGISAQEALKSTEEEYYDFLALQGITKRPTLNYRTLSDSVWNIEEGTTHPWAEQNLGTRREFFDTFFLKLYGPELFNSINTAAPYGQNDGALWQGKGYNASFTAGVRLEAYGLELTFKPQLAFSQNLAFDIMPSNYDSEYGYFWGYGHNRGIDAPQRFGDKPFFTYDWGDSEIRYSWKTLTAGFGTQAIWLGPAYLNPMLHSNNAPSYPKFDIGLRKQKITVPKLNWNLGYVEARYWLGYLSESDYFDNDTANDHTMFHGFSFAYSPPLSSELVFFINRVCLVPWKIENLKYMIPSTDNSEEDQKASFGFSWLFPPVGFEVYGEIGIDDYVADNIKGYIRYPYHTMTYTIGLKKTMNIKPQRNIYGILFFEWNNMEMSQDFQFMWPYTFYFHHVNMHGYTNNGQWLGNASSSGGSGQFLKYTVYYPKGNASLFIHRYNPDNNFFYGQFINETPAQTGQGAKYFYSWKANLNIGAHTTYFINKKTRIEGGIVYNLIENPSYYNKADIGNDEFMHNFNINISVGIKL